MPKPTVSKSKAPRATSICARATAPRTLTEIEWWDQSREDSYRLSTADRHYRGKMRVRTHFSADAKVFADDLYQQVGILPQSPCLILGYRGRPKKERVAIKRRWLSIMDARQRDAWRGFRKEHQRQYLDRGILTFGAAQKCTIKEPKLRTARLTPLSDAPRSYIISKIKEAASEKWDYNAIDWSST